MARKALLGNKIRRLRRQNELTQVEMAHRLEISASYLNLIEHNQRPLTLPLLLKLARIFEVDLQAFSEDDEARLMTALGEIFGDRLFTEHGVEQDDVRDLVGASPAACQAVLSLYGAYRTARDDVQALSERLSDDPLLSASSHELRTLLTSVRSFAEILHDNTDLRSGQRQRFLGILVEESRRLTAFVERVLERAGNTAVTGLADLRAPTEEVGDLIEAHGNHFPELEAAAEALRETLGVEEGALFGDLRRHLADHHGVDVTIASVGQDTSERDADDPDKRLTLHEALSAESRAFRVARQIGFLACQEIIEDILRQARLANPHSAALASGVLASYFAGAALMPYEAFQAAARALRHDVHGLQRRFGVSLEQVCHRLATLQRPGAEGVPLHFLRVDIAGNVSKRFGGSGFRIPRYGSICPRWPIHLAFLTPGRITAQLSELPDGERFFNIASAISKPAPRHGQPASHYAIMIGCDATHASAFVYADGLDLDGAPAVAPVGTTCRLCERADCEQRAFPPLGHEPTAPETSAALNAADDNRARAE